jgi:hypothetical protein
MTLRIGSLVVVLVVAAALHGWAGAQEEAIEAARTSARAWLALMDDNQYEETWDQAGQILKAAVSRDEWARKMSVTLGPLGKAESRAVRSSEYSTTMPGAPDGHYVVVKFDTTFQNKQTALETVTLREEDGAWKVEGYWIR